MTLDHVGPIARSIQDAAWLWAVLAGRDMGRIEPRAPRTLTLGVLDGYFTALLAGEVRAAFEDAVARLRDTGVSLPARSVIGTETIIDT
jgi:Asp-tRNA(Asn)/Glu-tRNA(Gln) amidotransferase A subunit family amidase